MTAKIEYVTKEGLDRMKEELNYLTGAGRADMARQIAEAREKGDLSENAEYDAAKEAQGYLEAKIAKLQDTIANARILDDKGLDTSKIMILSKVELKNLKLNKIFNYTLVSESEANLKEGKISITSPIGKGLIGKKAGEIVEIQTPGGIQKLEILTISR